MTKFKILFIIGVILIDDGVLELKVYEVPIDIRQNVLKEVMAMDYRSSGNHVFEEFCSFVEQKMKDNYGKTIEE